MPTKIPINLEAIGRFDPTPRPCACGCGRIVKPRAKNDIYLNDGCRNRAGAKRRHARAARKKAIQEVRRKLGLDS